MTNGRFTLQSLVLGLFVLAMGCNKSNNSAPSPGPGPNPAPGPAAGVPETGEHVAGKKVFNANCTRCHSIGGGAAPMMGKGKMQGPDLATVARDPEHTTEWLAEYVRDPRSKKPDSRMPPQRKIGDEDFKSLIEFLTSLK